MPARFTAFQTGVSFLVALGLAGCSDQAPATVPVVPPAALLGEFTGSKQFAASTVQLSLLTVSATDSIRGSARMTYTISSGSDEGTFAGTYVDGHLHLTLTLIATCAGGYTLDGVAEDSTGDAWKFTIQPTGACWHYATSPLRVLREDDPTFP